MLPQNVAAIPANAPNNGLLATSPYVIRDTSPQEWMAGGITYRPEGCQEGTPEIPCVDDADNDFSTTPSTPPDSVSWKPFDLTVSEPCTTFGNATAGGEVDPDLRARAERLLSMDTERQIGDELWTGTLAQRAIVGDADFPNIWLADVANVDILTESGPVTLTHGLACLQEYLNTHNGGQPGMIHTTAQVATHWESFRLLRREGNKLLTLQDNLVVTSPGYTGSSPDGTVGSNNIWAYATDMVRIYLGPIRTNLVMDRLQNDLEVKAQRPAIAEWQRCRHAGVRLAVEACDTGGS